MTDMWEYEPGVVYENLVRMMEYRGAVLTDPALDPAQVQLRMNQHGYATIVAVRNAAAEDPRGHACIHTILIAPGHDYSNKSPKFKTLLSGIQSVIDMPLEIIIITSNGITPHIKKVIDEHNGKPANLNLGTIYEYDYKHFVIETPRHNSCERHEIMSTADVNAFCEKFYQSKEDFAKITTADAHAIWLGLRPGMVTKVTRSSKSAGVSISYRLCSRA